MTNRVRYYITENGEEAVVRSVPVTITAQPQHELMSIERKPVAEEATRSASAKPVGRIVKVLRKTSGHVRN